MTKCDNCGKETKDGIHARVFFELLEKDGLEIDYDEDEKTFCRECLRGGVDIKIKPPENILGAK